MEGWILVKAEWFYYMCFAFIVIMKMAILKACISLSLEAILSQYMWLSHLESRWRFRSSGGENSPTLQYWYPSLFSVLLSSQPLVQGQLKTMAEHNRKTTLSILILCRLLAKSFVCQGSRLCQRKASPDSDFCVCQGEDCILGFLTWKIFCMTWRFAWELQAWSWSWKH